MMMATKKAGKTSKNGRDSIGRRLGVKVNNKEKINAGGIILRQRGLVFKTLYNTYLGKDFTIHAKIDGVVKFIRKKSNVFISVESI